MSPVPAHESAATTPARRRRASSPRAALGFRDGEKGAHSSRTLMLAELTQALAATTAMSTREDFRSLIVGENLLGKRTESNRIRADRYLSQLYGLDPSIPIYRIFRRLWDADAASRPLLAVLAASTRDPLLRASAPGILAIPIGEGVEPARVGEALSSVSPRFTPNTVASMARNVSSSFTQSGHLQGASSKLRSRAVGTPAAATFAAALGWMEGGRGQFLLSSFWARLLDRNAAEVLDLLLAAGRAGWIDVRSAAGVVELRMERLFTPAELELCDGQSD